MTAHGISMLGLRNARHYWAGLGLFGYNIVQEKQIDRPGGEDEEEK